MPLPAMHSLTPELLPAPGGPRRVILGSRGRLGRPAAARRAPLQRLAAPAGRAGGTVLPRAPPQERAPKLARPPASAPPLSASGGARSAAAELHRRRKVARMERAARRGAARPPAAAPGAGRRAAAAPAAVQGKRSAAPASGALALGAGAPPGRAEAPLWRAWAAAVPELDGLHKPVGLMLASALVLSSAVQLSGA